MNARIETAAAPSTTAASAPNKVLRNTCILLSASLLVSALAAGASAAFRLPSPGLIVTLIGYFGLLFMVTRNQNNASGIGWVFALTGFMGYTLGPVLSAHLALPNGGAVVAGAMAGTAGIFLGLSAWASISKKDFSFLGPFLAVGALTAFVAGLAAAFLHIPALSLTVSAAFVLISSGLILFEMGNILRGGETNYISATVSLFVSLFNIFTSLLNLLGFGFGSND